MTKSRNFKRAIAVISVLAIILCFAQTAVFAANTVDVYDGIYDGTNVTVKGSISTAGAEMTMLAVRTDTENKQLSDYATPDDLAAAVQFIDQITATSDNFEQEWTFALRDGSEGDWLVVFVSGTDAEVKRLAISLTDVKTGVNGTLTFADGTDYEGSLPSPFFTTDGGDDDWVAQLDITVTDEAGEAVEATVDAAAGTVSFEAPFEKATYTVTVANTSDDYPAFEESKTFTFISEEGAAAAEAIEELNALPANLGVTVDKGDDAYTFTLPEDTENVTFTATVDGVAVEDNPVVVDRAEEGGDAKQVEVTATAKGTDATKKYTVGVPAKGVVGPAITEADVTIISDEEGEIIENVYKKFLGNGNIIVTINAGAINPDETKVTVSGKEFFYVATRNYFVGIIPAADKAAIIAGFDAADGATDRIVYGKDPIDGDPEDRLDNGDYAAIKKISLGKVNNPTDKQLLSSDVSDGVMDGAIDNGDFADVKKVSLRKVSDLAINTAN